MQVILVVFGIVLTIYGIYEIIYSGRNHFDSNKLYQSIEEQNLMKEHPHSIVLIKDTFNQHTNRYLLYYDRTGISTSGDHRTWIKYLDHSR